ncbi:sialidase family protein [Kitasatospora viridis]|uniref:BNR/Asp-box repeat protein n=1 Tax=Kitasatospora viridis TaxID=281105 RepID=A0A561SGB1_9ACTN|nr:sialidase family protein [Kitasatospora viridis]TWF73847.1 BNR/Asp-box repeat protein [Kitasatospora viridis]
MHAPRTTLRTTVAGLCAGAAALALCTLPAQAAAPRSPAVAATYTTGTPSEVSAGCAGQNAETIQAADPAANAVYEVWMGCKGIGLAASTNGGNSFATPLTLPGSTGQKGSRTWDPAVTVAPDGTVYASFMTSRSGQSYPVVDVSTDHGASFRTAGVIVPPDQGNWGDRDFIAAGPDGTLYLTWDYGPSAAAVTSVCPPSGSCAFATGDVNAVVQKSTDGGRTWSAMSHISPGYPNSGGDSAPVLVEPDGSIDVVYQGYAVTNVPTDDLTVAYTYASRSTDGGATWSPPVRIGPDAGTMNSTEWWIDGAEALGPDGTLYATWDTQGSTTDTGWLAYSTDHGATWSTPVQAPPDTLNVPHLIQVVAGPPGIAYVSWLSSSDPRGYAQYLRTFSIAQGWLSDPVQVSRSFGATAVWPGDTFGLSALSPTRLVLGWGSAVAPDPTTDQIWSDTVDVTLP